VNFYEFSVEIKVVLQPVFPKTLYSTVSVVCQIETSKYHASGTENGAKDQS